jgi:hypothetical protein
MLTEFQLMLIVHDTTTCAGVSSLVCAFTRLGRITWTLNSGVPGDPIGSNNPGANESLGGSQ